MEKCPVCLDGRLMTRLSSAGAEQFCLDCRRITKSASFNFEFKVAGSDEGVQECKGPDSDPRPGFKGPGAKAKCWLYDPGDENQKASAQRKARNSAYSAQHKKAASRIINSTAYFTGAPSSVVPNMAADNPINDLAALTEGVMGTPTNPSTAPQNFAAGNPTTQAANPTTQVTNPTTQAANPTMVASSAKSPFDLDETGIEQSPIGSVTAPGGLQPGDLNSNNPLNSGTTASKRLAELIEDDVRNHMGKAFCTEHMDYDGCNPDRNSQ